MAFGRRAVGGRERDAPAIPGWRHRPRRRDPIGSAVTLRERDNPGNEALGRNFYPSAAACGRILHYSLPHHAYYPYYCCITRRRQPARGGPPIDDDDKEHVYEPGDSDVRHVTRRHLHAPRGHGLGPG